MVFKYANLYLIGEKYFQTKAIKFKKRQNFFYESMDIILLLALWGIV